MFQSDPTHDPHSQRTTRRVFLFGASAVAGAAGISALLKAPGVEASTNVHGTPGEVTIANFANDGTPLGTETVAKIVKTDGEWYRQLGRGSFEVARQADTELAYTGAYLNEHSRGVFRCACCETALFSSQTKYDSGTGWPSFWAPIAPQNIATRTDKSLGITRTEVQCARCEAHLGHVFNDGPEPTGLRYCLNSVSLHFAKA